MVTDQQVRRLKKLMNTEDTKEIAARKAGMSKGTANKYVKTGQIPSQCKEERLWRTRQDLFEEVWGEVEDLLEINGGLEAKTIFVWLQQKHEGRFQDGQLRTLQNKIRRWRATEGPGKEVFFCQRYFPGILSESDYTRMSDLGVSIGGVLFNHMVYHFVLPYSNWETGTICFSESFESFSEGFQNAMWQLGGVTREHRTDCLTAAVKSIGSSKEFTRRYKSLINHYRVEAKRTQPASPHENGDVEQRHYRFKKAVDQALMLRGSRDFIDRQDYQAFLQSIYRQLNAGRKERFIEEVRVLRQLPVRRLEGCQRIGCKVGVGSTINIKNNVYSVPSRLIGEDIEVRLFSEYLDVWYAQKHMVRIPRLRGDGKHFINYRHIIDSLVRKPGAFENYRYQDDLFPTSRFRRAYDSLQKADSLRASKEYVNILKLAATESEERTDMALNYLLDKDMPVTCQAVEELVKQHSWIKPVTEVQIAPVDLGQYDSLLESGEVGK